MVTSQNEFGKLFTFKLNLCHLKDPLKWHKTLKTVPRKRIYHPRL